MAVGCQTLSKVLSTGAAAGVLPETMAASEAACSAVSSVPDMWGTPLNVFAYRGRDSSNNPYREKLWLTGSDYPNALNAKDAYITRYPFTCTKYYGQPGKPPSEFLQRLLKAGNEMEPKAFALWNRLHRGQYIAIRSGLLLDQVYPHLFGATPDGLVFDWNTKEMLGTLELKYRPQAKLSSTKEEIPQKYLIQMIGQLMCLPVFRWFYLEMGPTGEYFKEEGTITQETKDMIREDLVRYKLLVTTNDADTFPQRCVKYSKLP